MQDREFFLRGDEAALRIAALENLHPALQHQTARRHNQVRGTQPLITESCVVPGEPLVFAAHDDMVPAGMHCKAADDSAATNQLLGEHLTQANHMA